MLRSVVVPGVLLIGVSLAPWTANAAERPPQLNLEPTCTVTSLGLTGRTREACMNSEQAARDTLAGVWKEFSAGQQQRCTSLVHMGGPPSYVELLTCLEMAKQAKAIPDGDSMRGAPGMGVAKD